MAFDEVQLSEDVERGAQGGPKFKTTILELWSGHEVRNIDWQRARGEWDVGYGVQNLTLLNEVVAFFYARQGRGRGFRFKDWADYVGTEQNLGVGDAAEDQFQLRKQYTSGLVTYNRIINKPATGTVRCFLDAVETFDFTVDTTTGLVTFTSAPGAGVVVTATYEFDVPVRFDTDKLDVNVVIFNAGSIPSIPIVELRQ